MNYNLAWAAGFFDGEGNIRFDKRNRLVLHIAQTTLEPLERFQKAVGVGKIYGPYAHKNKPQDKPYWVYTANSKGDVAKAIRSISPMLSPAKYEQAKNALAKFLHFQESR